VSRRGAFAVLAGAALLAVARLWAMPLPASLWLDEFGTVWVSDGGIARVIERARLFPQSIPYAALVAIVRGAFGSSEVVLRLPSLLAMLGVAWLVVRLGRACFGADAGLLAGGAFLLFPAIAFAAGDARPYALGVLAATAALLRLKAWLDTGRARDAAGYVLAAAAAVYLQYLFAAALAGHAVYAVFRWRRGTPVSLRALGAAAAAIGVLLVPAAMLVGEIGASRGAHRFGTLPDALRLFDALAPWRALGVLVPAVLVAVVARGARGFRPPSAADGLMLLLSGALAPPLALFAASRAFSTPVFEVRYLLETAPAWAALLGGCLAGLEPAGAGPLSLAGAIVLALALRGEPGRLRPGHGREDWRSAVGSVERAAPGAPILLSGSFVEAGDPSRAADPRHQEYLVAPVKYYAPKTKAAALPPGSPPGAEALAERLAGPSLAGPRFAVIERRSRVPSRRAWVDGLAAERGFSGRDLWTDGPLSVRLYERSGGGD